MALMADAMKDYNPSNEENTGDQTNQALEEAVAEMSSEETSEETSEEVTEDTTEEVIDNTDENIEFVAEDVVEEEVITEESVAEEDVVQDDFVLDDNINISNQTEGEYETVSDLLADYNALKESTVSGEDLFERLDEQAESEFGLKYHELVSWQNTDYDNMNAMDVLAEVMEMNDPDIDREDIIFELEKYDLLKESPEKIKEMIEDGEISQRDYDGLKRGFKADVRLGRASLKQFRDDNLDLSKIKINTAQKQEQAYQPTAEDIENQKQEMRSDLNGFNKLRMNVGGKEVDNVDFNIDDSEKDELVETLSDPSWLAKRWTNEDGSTNKNKAYRDAYIIKNVNKMLRAAHSEGIAKGAKQTVVNEDNITLGSAKPVGSPGKKDPLAEAGEKLSQNYF
jgi:hypothetical protein